MNIEGLQKLLPWLAGLQLGPKIVISVIILLVATFILLLIWSPTTQTNLVIPKVKTNQKIQVYEFTITPETRKIDTKIDVKMGEYISGEIDLSNPFHINTSKKFSWMPEFMRRYQNQGTWIGPIKYISPSGMETYDDKGNQINFTYPDVVLKTWGAIYLQIGENKYRIENLSIKNSLINNPPETKMKPFLIEEPGRIFIYVNPHPYIEGTEGEIIVRINKNE